MMMVGAIGQGLVPPSLFGVVERFSVLAAVGFDAVLGLWLFSHDKGDSPLRQVGLLLEERFEEFDGNLQQEDEGHDKNEKEEG